jgi:hypothetical protein
MNQWRFKLDSNLPGDLRQIAEWIYRAEENLARGIPFQASNYSAEENYRRFKELLDEHQVKRKKNVDFFFMLRFHLGDFY